MLLLNPGPVTLTTRVRQSLLQPDLCHRESEFFDLQDEVRTRLLGAYQLDPEEWAAVLLTGSGTAAVESMIAALVPEQGKLLILENGVYGERITHIASQYQITYTVLHHDWMEALDLTQLTACLDGDPTITHVAVIHHETTTGRRNDLDALAAVCDAYGVSLLVDAVSSFGAEEIDFASGKIAAIAATANKCLHGVPGVSFVIVQRNALMQAERRTYYLDLSRLAHLQEQRNTPFTPAVHAYYALIEALREFDEEGGWRARHHHYATLAEQVRAGLAAHDIPSVLPPEHSSVVLRSYQLPAALSYAQLHDGLKAMGFVIYAGQGGLSNQLFRISTMGAITTGDIDRLLNSFATLLH